MWWCHAARAAVIATTVAVYDPSSKANAVDITAPGSSITLGDFTTAVAAAYAANQGGVVDFDLASTIAVDPAADTSYTFRYGTLSAKKLLVTTSAAIDVVTNVNPTSGTVSTISGAGVWTNQTTGLDLLLSFGGLQDFTTSTPLANEFLTSVAFTLLSRNNYGAGGTSVVATATLDDLSTIILSDNISNVRGGDDTFFSFAAPTGRYFTSINLDATLGSGATAGTTLAIDDFAFTTTVIPEPSISLILSGTVIGLFCLPVLRRRMK